MARKQEFDPLGGFSGSGSRKSSRKDKKSYDVLGAGKYGDSGSIYDDVSYDPAPVTEYSDALLSTGYEEEHAPKKQKPGLFAGMFKKKDKHSAQKAAAASAAVASGAARFDDEEQVPKYHHSADADITINDGVMETGIIQRYDESDDAALFDDEPAPAKARHNTEVAANPKKSAEKIQRPERYDENGYLIPYDDEKDEPVQTPARTEYPQEKDVFVPERKPRTEARAEEMSMPRPAAKPQEKPAPQSVEEDLFGDDTPAAAPTPVPASVPASVPHAKQPSVPQENYDDDLFGDADDKVGEKVSANVSDKVSENPAVHAQSSLNPHVCHLCGNVSKEELPEFGFDAQEFVPLCKICTRAVSTLMKHTDPVEEEEIYSEWSLICPGLDEKRAKELVRKGRSSL